MIRNIILIFIIIFSFKSIAEDISEFEIEGISIGDSLLDFMSEEEIIKGIELSKSVYNYLNDDFGEVYMYLLIIN